MKTGHKHTSHLKSNIRPTIAVCLLTYNHAHLIESTLDSILRQTLIGYEIIVSDDCSTDNTWAILQRMAVEEPRIRVIRTPQNLGAG